MPTKKTQLFTITQAAHALGVTRAAVHNAIRKGRLNAEWGETIQTIRKRALLVSSADLSNYRVDPARQFSGKKNLISLDGVV